MTMGKTLSIVFLFQTTPKVYELLSCGHSGFHQGYSRADVVFEYQWICAKARWYCVGIDMGRAFDTVWCDKLFSQHSWTCLNSDKVGSAGLTPSLPHASDHWRPLHTEHVHRSFAPSVRTDQPVCLEWPVAITQPCAVSAI